MSGSQRRQQKRKERRESLKKSGKKRAQPQQTFQDVLADATLNKFSSYIDSSVEQVGRRLAAQQRDTLETLYTRILAAEELFLEIVPGLTKEGLSARVATIQDRNAGYEAAEDGAQLGDRVRLRISTKTSDQTEFQGSSRLQVDNVGSGNTIGKEIEEAILGLKAGEVKTIDFGENKEMQAQLDIDRVSRLIKKEEPKVEAPVEAAKTEENPSVADQNAG